MIYTSYYSNKNIPSSMTQISISRIPPVNWKGIVLQEFAPSMDLFTSYKRGNITPSQFCEYFIDQLQRNSLVGFLQAMNNYETDIVLLCYEKPNQFCHRHLLSKFAAKYDIIIKELD